MLFAISIANWFDVSKLNYSSDRETFFHVDSFGKIIPNMDNIFVVVEPNAIYMNMFNFDIRAYILKNWKKYTKVLTYDEEILKSCPNAVKYVYGTTWIKPHEYENVDTSKKEFQISSITGVKDVTLGHKMRLIMYFQQNKIPIPYVCFRSHEGNLPIVNTNPILNESKVPLFEMFQFSFVIENSRQTNYFTEKLMDCLLMKTIPVYYGCPNIHEYFDTHGWIILENENVEEAFQKVSELTPQWYSEYKDVIDSNYEKAKSYTDIYRNISYVL